MDFFFSKNGIHFLLSTQGEPFHSSLGSKDGGFKEIVHLGGCSQSRSKRQLLRYRLTTNFRDSRECSSRGCNLHTTPFLCADIYSSIYRQLAAVVQGVGESPSYCSCIIHSLPGRSARRRFVGINMVCGEKLTYSGLSHQCLVDLLTYPPSQNVCLPVGCSNITTTLTQLINYFKVNSSGCIVNRGRKKCID